MLLPLVMIEKSSLFKKISNIFSSKKENTKPENKISKGNILADYNAHGRRYVNQKYGANVTQIKTQKKEVDKGRI